MFFNIQNSQQRSEYQEFLKIAGCLSNLFSDSNVPYLYYRVAEKVFCRAFGAEDLSRSDVSADAKKGSIGIGLKTFLQGNNKTFQKVAEFNSDRSLYVDLKADDLIYKVSELRNKRIEFTTNAYELNNAIYHCVIRDEGKFKIFEESMDRINLDKIHNIKTKNRNSISFEDDKNEYSFLLTKSTLTKRFITTPVLYEFDVEILKDPLLELRKLLKKKDLFLDFNNTIIQTIYLPLYSKKRGQNIVHEKSGLNYWNAGGRERHLNEVYIPFPAGIRKSFIGFFPDRQTSFNLKLPNGKIMKSKICQENGKALMSYSNRDLGQWILRDVLKLKEGTLLTYDKLQEIGIDSVRIDKINNLDFEINFTGIGVYDKFLGSLG